MARARRLDFVPARVDQGAGLTGDALDGRRRRQGGRGSHRAGTSLGVVQHAIRQPLASFGSAGASTSLVWPFVAFEPPRAGAEPDPLGSASLTPRNRAPAPGQAFRRYTRWRFGLVLQPVAVVKIQARRASKGWHHTRWRFALVIRRTDWHARGGRRASEGWHYPRWRFGLVLQPVAVVKIQARRASEGWHHTRWRFALVLQPVAVVKIQARRASEGWHHTRWRFALVLRAVAFVRIQARSASEGIPGQATRSLTLIVCTSTRIRFTRAILARGRTPTFRRDRALVSVELASRLFAPPAGSREGCRTPRPPAAVISERARCVPSASRLTSRNRGLLLGNRFVPRRPLLKRGSRCRACRPFLASLAPPWRWPVLCFRGRACALRTSPPTPGSARR